MMGPEEEPTLRKYRLIAEIGRGGMADVHLAVVQGPAGFNKLVVIKRTLPELAADPDFLAMFLDEARLAARLNHPNVVQTTEVGQDGKRYFIAMEYLDGQPLNRIRARAGAAFTTILQVRVIADVLAGLHHAHELCDFDGTPLNVVHRDVTPQNVFVTYDGLVKVVDFGIAKAIDSSSITRTGVVKGKVTYMAPEQARGVSVDRRADIFAVGVMLWEGIAGRRMWKGTPDVTVIHELFAGKIPSIREAVPTVPDALAQICERALAPNANDRYATAQEMHEALDAFMASYGAHVTARDVGKSVAEWFAEDRAKVKALIESQLRDVRWSGAYPRATAVDLPKIDPGQALVTPSDLTFDGGAPLPTSQRDLRPSMSSITVMNANSSVTEPRETKPSRPVLLIGVGALVAVAVVALGVRFLIPQPALPPTTAQSTVMQAALPPKTQEAERSLVQPGQDSVKLTVRVTPSTAKVFLDDVLLSAGPFEGKVRKSDEPHKIRVDASRYTSKEETVVLRGDVILSVTLDKAPATGPAAPPAPRPHNSPAPQEPAPPPPPPPPPVTAPPAPAQPAGAGQKPRRAIDSDSPYQ